MSGQKHDTGSGYFCHARPPLHQYTARPPVTALSPARGISDVNCTAFARKSEEGEGGSGGVLVSSAGPAVRADHEISDESIASIPGRDRPEVHHPTPPRDQHNPARPGTIQQCPACPMTYGTGARPG